MKTTMNRDIVFVALDTETAGLDPTIHEIIEIGAVYRDSGGEHTFQSLVSGRFASVNPVAMRINGIALDEARQAPPLPTVMQQWWTWLNSTVWSPVLLIHNAPFDLGFLPPSFADCCLVYDTSALIRALYPLDLSLQKLLVHFDISAQGPAHRALGDARDLLTLWEVAIAPRLADKTTVETLALIAQAPPSTRHG